jgi:hypothetical protein
VHVDNDEPEETGVMSQLTTLFCDIHAARAVRLSDHVALLTPGTRPVSMVVYGAGPHETRRFEFPAPRF